MTLAATFAGHAGDRHGHAARIRNAIERPGEGGCEHDDPIAAPCASITAEGSFAQNPHGAAGHINGVQLSVSEEADPATVRCPEGQPCTVK